MRFFRSRKAQTELTLQQIIGIVLAFAVVLATVGLFFSLMMMFVGPPDSGSVSTLNILFDTVMAFDNPNNHNDSCYIRPVYIGEDWSIVGFNEDGVAAADSNSIICRLGEDCIEEQCGIDDNIIKPGQCGNGPCLCLCDGGGDVNGDDCQESNAVCRKIPRSAGFDRFYWSDRDDCTIGWDVPGRARDQHTNLCDLVIPSESCVLQTNEGVHKSLIVMKIHQGTHEENQIYVDRVVTSEFDDWYPDIDVDCRTMVENLRRFRAAVVGETLPDENEQGDPDTLYQEIDTIRRN